MNTLMDTHGRRIRYLRVSVTDRCNLRCRYCMPENGIDWLPHERIMRYEEFLRIIQVAARLGVDKVRLTGGEPLVRKDFLDFVANVSRIEGIADLSLTTNAVLLESMAPALRAHGISRVNISLDTLEKKKFAYIARTDAFERVMSGIQAAKDQGLRIKINVVAIRGFNDDEVLDFAALTLHEPVEVRFIELMPMGCAARFDTSQTIKAFEIRRLIEQGMGGLSKVVSGLGPAALYRIPGASGLLGFIEPVSERSFCARCNRIRISASGGLRPCLFSDRQLDLLGPLRAGIDDAGLEELIRAGVALKPLSGLDIHQGCETLMSRIGG
ncbi:MAG: GTP 3',8-cyclase MoaA [Syntrophaceae bacterium]